MGTIRNEAVEMVRVGGSIDSERKRKKRLPARVEMKMGKHPCRACGSVWKARHYRGGKLLKVTCYVCGKKQYKTRSKCWR